MNSSILSTLQYKYSTNDNAYIKHILQVLGQINHPIYVISLSRQVFHHPLQQRNRLVISNNPNIINHLKI